MIFSFVTTSALTKSCSKTKNVEKLSKLYMGWGDKVDKTGINLQKYWNHSILNFYAYFKINALELTYFDRVLGKYIYTKYSISK